MRTQLNGYEKNQKKKKPQIYASVFFDHNDSIINDLKFIYMYFYFIINHE